MADHLRALWDFDDLDASEERFRELLETESDDASRASILTQLARVQGLRGDFAHGEQLIEEAEQLAGDDASAGIRIDLERGRLRRSSGDREAALPLFESAFAAGKDAGEGYLAADAAHMAALASPDDAGFVAWTETGIEVAQSSASARYWLGPLLNNLGWHLYEAGEHEGALDAFRHALHARERDPGNRAPIEIARYAVGKTLRALGRPDEAAALLEQAVAWTKTVGAPDGWFHEELAEDYAALGQTTDARRQAKLALDLLPAADPGFATDDARASRLRELAGEGGNDGDG
jgi:tetratricopeptide (TPR) repeat protein